MTLLRQMKIQDGTDSSKVTEVTDNKELKVKDTDLVNLNTSANLQVTDLLYDVIRELKKTNLHLSLMTDTLITNGEVD